MEVLGELLETIYWITAIISFFAFIKLYSNKSLKISLRIFFLYPSITILLMILSTLCKYEYLDCDVFVYTNKYSLLFHFVFLTWFITIELKDSKIRKTAKSLMILLFPLILCLIIYNQEIKFLEYVVAYMCVFIFTSLYFVDIFLNIPEKQLTTIPDFWIILGIFVNAVILIPPLALSSIVINNYPNYIGLMKTLTSLSVIIMYLSFIKGALCTRTLQN